MQRALAGAGASIGKVVSTKSLGYDMAQVGRNERCPCGSGKKFKHCCLLAQLQPSHEALTARRLGRLADWIVAKFRSQIPAQADEFFFEFDAEEREILNSGKHAGANGVATLVTDFISIDGVFELHDVKQNGLDWFLQVGGPMSHSDRAFYEALSCSGLRAYRVLSVNPGTGMELLDLFAPEMESGFVHEKSGSMQLAVNDVIGARLLMSDGVMQIAAMVLFQPTDADLLVENYAEDWAFARAQAGFSHEDEYDAELDATIAEYALEHRADAALADAEVGDIVEIPSDVKQASTEMAESDVADRLAVADVAEDDDAKTGEFDLAEMRNIVDEMTLQDMVAARVVSTYWLESVLSSLGHQRIDNAADE